MSAFAQAAFAFFPTSILKSRKASKAALSGASTLPALWWDVIDLPLLSHRKSQKVLWGKALRPWNSETDKWSWQEARGKLPTGLPEGIQIHFYCLRYLKMAVALWAARGAGACLRTTVRQAAGVVMAGETFQMSTLSANLLLSKLAMQEN